MQEQLLHELTTPYGRYQVVDTVFFGQPARVLFTDNRVVLSAMALGRTGKDSLFGYVRRFFEVAEALQPARLLLIGGGTYTLPAALLAQFPHVQIDAVEIDPELTALAKQFFGVQDDPRCRIIHADGADFIKRAATVEYDLIIIDAFVVITIPPSLISRAAAANYQRILTANGALVMNSITSYAGPQAVLVQNLRTAFGPSFANVDFYQVDPGTPLTERQNLFLTAHQQPLPALQKLWAAPLG